MGLEEEIEKHRINKYHDEKINVGKKSYREYLAEAYGNYRTKKILDPKSQQIINSLQKKKQEAADDLLEF